MTKVGFLDLLLFFVHIIFAIIDTRQNFTNFQIILCRTEIFMLLLLNVNMLFQFSQRTIEFDYKFFKTHADLYFECLFSILVL